MYYTLFNKNELIGVFDNKDKVENMINGLIQNLVRFTKYQVL